MDADLAGDRAVWPETGVATAADPGHLVVACEGEVDVIRCVMAVIPSWNAPNAIRPPARTKWM